MPGNSNGPSPQPAAGLLLEQLQRQLTTDYSDLVTAYHHALQDTLFTNRSELRPAMLGQIAAAEAKVVVAFLEQPVPVPVAHRQTVLDMRWLGHEHDAGECGMRPPKDWAPSVGAPGS